MTITTRLKTTVAALALASIASSAFAAEKSGWSYAGPTGPNKWGELSADYHLCKAGLQQSPIDLAEANALGEIPIKTNYTSGPLTILNNGHTVQANFAEGSSLTSGKAEFKLLQVHFHTPSEEAVAGKRYPMVAHLVHADGSGKLAVLGVLFEEGAANPELTKIIDTAPSKKADPKLVSSVTIDPAGLLPASRSVYRFQGSLTTPPCSEGVNWHVIKQPATASKEQIAALHKIMGDNARPLQPLHGRLVVAPSE
ncbi:MAG: hypothetical protein CFE28_06230 [Alphaproteobacteria bacterium PA2]|nr:MAG: hypothetical protein CFE28_06230 [Alphaproteobacteria bacterium PA2]